MAMKQLNQMMLFFFMLTFTGVLSYGVYLYRTQPDKIQHKKVAGCRWLKFPGILETWQHNPNCDSSCHLVSN